MKARVRVRALLPVVSMSAITALMAGSLPAEAVNDQDGRRNTAGCSLAKAGPIYVVSDIPQHVDAVACELVGRSVRFQDLGVSVPAPGETITLFGDSENGSRELKVAVDASGLITFSAANDTDQVTAVSTTESPIAPEDPSTPSAAQLASTGGCGVYSYALTGFRIAGGYAFYRGDGASPTNAGATAFADAMNRAASNITTVQNPCGVGDGVSVNYTNLGGDSRESDFYVNGATSECLNGREGDDAVSTVDFGPLSSSYVGLACVRSSNGTVQEADVRLNSYKSWTYSGGSTNCPAYHYDVEGVLTHEFGHVFGLNHVTSRYQTMYDTAISCDNWQRNLGQGDATGLNAIY